MKVLLIFLICIAVAYGCTTAEKVKCVAAAAGCGTICVCDVPVCECCAACLACVVATTADCCDCLFPSWSGCYNKNLQFALKHYNANVTELTHGDKPCYDGDGREVPSGTCIKELPYVYITCCNGVFKPSTTCGCIFKQ